jgi:hypothetical protein
VKFIGKQNHMINDKFLLLACCSDQFVKIRDMNEYKYYHIILENDNIDKQYGIWADGVLTETICERFYFARETN